MPPHGRRVAGKSRAKDVMDRHTQQRHDFAVEKLPDFSTVTEVLADNMVTPPPDAAAFRVDFPRWLGSLRERVAMSPPST